VDGSEPGRVTPRPDAAASRLPDDATLVVGLRARDEEIFGRLITAWGPTMLRLARGHVSSRETAADIVQETWLAVLRGIDGFEGRSALRTWVFRILSNIAKTSGTRERRIVVRPLLGEGAVPTVPAHRFRDSDDEYPGGWRSFPEPWPSLHNPESEVLRTEVRMTVTAAIRALPARQRLVVTMRDIEGFTGNDVCELLGLTPANQRVILHRGRAAVRALLENHFGASARWSAMS
jgi:RNA polymerase sigma-70 factor, ECF subfamily